MQPPRTFEGINKSQKRQLGKRISSKKSREENWYLIYQILFPDADPPDSPYIDDISLSEELLTIREFANQVAPARIARFLHTRLPLELRSNQEQIELLVRAAMRDVFDMVLENWESSQSSQSSVENTPHRSTPGSNHDSGYSTSPPSGIGSSHNVSGGFNDEPVRRFLPDTLPAFVPEPSPSAQSLFEEWNLEHFLNTEI